MPQPFRNMFKDLRKPHERLSAMQYACAAGAVHGLTKTAIGKKLYINRRTVAIHINRALTYMNLPDISALKAYAKKHGVFNAFP